MINKKGYMLKINNTNNKNVYDLCFHLTFQTRSEVNNNKNVYDIWFSIH